MNKFILGLLLIPILLVGICAVSASPDDSGAEIPVVEHTADIHSDVKDCVKIRNDIKDRPDAIKDSLQQTSDDVKDYSAFFESLGIFKPEPENIPPITPSKHWDIHVNPHSHHDNSQVPPKPPKKF